jgi:hypothetical protein
VVEASRVMHHEVEPTSGVENSLWGRLGVKRGIEDGQPDVADMNHIMMSVFMWPGVVLLHDR